MQEATAFRTSDKLVTPNHDHLLKMHSDIVCVKYDGDFIQYNRYGLLTKCEVKMAGYWPSSFFVCVYGPRRINSQKKNKANIQPS